MSSYYPYSYSYGSYYPEEWILQFFAGLLLVGLIFAFLIGLIFYIFQSVGLYRVAKRRTIRHAWLAWLPVGNSWIMGSISDQYQYVVKGKIKSRRLILVVLSAMTVVLSVVTASLSVDIVAVLVGEILFGTGTMDPVRLLSVFSLAVVECILAVIYMVFHYLAVYDLYSSCTSRHNVLYLVLGIIFNFLEPFFLFACRDRDEGMPPRREETAWCEEPIYQEPVYQQPEQTWTEE